MKNKNDNKYFGMPGPGGSLGECAVCGKAFLREILTGGNVRKFSIKGVGQVLHGHEDCIKTLRGIGKDWQKLPEGPLRKAFEEANNADKGGE